MSVGERIAFEEIYRLHIHGDGKRERKTRRICEEMLGSRACALIRADIATEKHIPRRDPIRPATAAPSAALKSEI